MESSQHNKQVQVAVSATKFGKYKDKKSGNKCNFIGVRQRPSGKWVSEIKDTTHDIRMWLGTFKTPEEAARAYDEAACLLRGSNTRTNFTASQSHFSSKPTLSLKIRNLLNQKINSKRSSSKSNTAEPVNRSLGSSCGIVGGDVAVTNQEVKVFGNEEWSSCRGEFEMGFCQFSNLWGNFSFEMNLDEPPLLSNEALELQREVAEMQLEPTLMMPMFEVNGMSEYLENIYGGADTMGQIFCPS